jgi:hypothetical protein
MKKREKNWKLTEDDLCVLRRMSLLFCALLVILCSLYLAGILQGTGMLNLLLLLGIALHVILAVLFRAREKNFWMGSSVLLALFYLAALLYFVI